MSIALSIAIVLIITTGLLGGFVLVQKPIQKKNIIFSILILFSIIWILSNYLANSEVYETAIFWNKSAYAASALIPYILFEISYTFIDRFKISNILRFILLASTIFVFYISLFTKYIILDIKFVQYGTEPVLADTFLIHPIFFVLITLIVGFLLYKQYKNSISKTNKFQLQYFAIGIFLSLFFGFFFNVIMPIFLNSYEIAQYGTLSTVFLIGFTAYAITKHHLFDTRVIITEIITILIVLGLLFDAFLSDSWQKMIFKIIIVILVAYGGYLLIRNVLNEINKRKRFQELTNELRVANKRLAELDALKTEFVSMASHELLTPISAIQGYLHMILEEKIISLADPKAEEVLKKVYGSSNRLARLVTDLLNVSRIESGRMIMEKQSFDINRVIQTTVSELKIKAQEKNLKIVWSPQVHFKVMADKDKLKQVLTNIISNAIKYTEKGEIEVHTKFEENQALGIKLEGSGSSIKRIFQKGNFVVVEVKDSGIGIPKEEINTIFQKFHRIGDWKTRNTQGTGLGLYIAKNITEMMGGKIWVESEYGKGSIFSFSVPINNDTIKKDKNNE